MCTAAVACCGCPIFRPIAGGNRAGNSLWSESQAAREVHDEGGGGGVSSAECGIAAGVGNRVWIDGNGRHHAATGTAGSLGQAAERIAPKRLLRVVPKASQPAEAPEVKPEYAFYRKYTEGILRRYEQFSVGYGRTPSLLGRELFQTKVTTCKVESFDDAVIFVHDVGKCLAKLDPVHRGLLRRIALQGYTQEETAKLLGLSKRTVWLRYADALDELTGLLLEARLLEPFLARR